MKILIWQSYGDISVYVVDTEEQKQKVTELLIACLNYYTSDFPVIKQYNLRQLVDWINEYCNGDDNFENIKLTKAVDFYE